MVFSIVHILSLLDYARYQFIFDQLSPRMILARYLVSWSLRIMGLLIGLGLLCHHELARRAACAISVFTITTIAWKHPLVTINKAVAFSFARWYSAPQRHFDSAWTGPLDLSHAMEIAQFLLIGIDLVFAVSVIFYLTRPSVRARFTKGPGLPAWSWMCAKRGPARNATGDVL